MMIVQPVSVGCLNVQTLRKKATPVTDNVVSQDLYVLELTEMWIGIDTDQLTINELVPTSYVTLITFVVKLGNGLVMNCLNT